MLGWQHPGFSVFRGEPVDARDPAARERLVRYLLHPAFAMERLHYDPAAGTITYNPATQARDRHGQPDSLSVSSAEDWLAAIVTHIPDI